MSSRSGLFVTLEGVEGTGKSTLTREIVHRLTLLGVPTVATREPGGSSLGGLARAALLDPHSPALSARAEALLFAADRAQHVAEVIAPALGDGKVVVCDRFVDSSIAYQGRGRGLGEDAVALVNRFALDGLRPDLTLLVDLDPRVGLARKQLEEINRMEREDLAFHDQVRAALLDAAAAEPDRFIVLDGQTPLLELLEVAMTAIARRSGGRGQSAER